MNRALLAAAVVAVTAIVASSASALAAPPPNDNFDSRISASGNFLSHSANTADATLQLPDEPQPCANIGKTVWYQFIPTVSGTYRLGTENSDYNTTLAVYVGESLTALQPVACDNDSGLSYLALINELHPADAQLVHHGAT